MGMGNSWERKEGSWGEDGGENGGNARVFLGIANEGRGRSGLGKRAGRPRSDRGVLFDDGDAVFAERGSKSPPLKLGLCSFSPR